MGNEILWVFNFTPCQDKSKRNFYEITATDVTTNKQLTFHDLLIIFTPLIEVNFKFNQEITKSFIIFEKCYDAEVVSDITPLGEQYYEGRPQVSICSYASNPTGYIRLYDSLIPNFYRKVVNYKEKNTNFNITFISQLFKYIHDCNNLISCVEPSEIFLQNLPDEKILSFKHQINDLKLKYSEYDPFHFSEKVYKNYSLRTLDELSLVLDEGRLKYKLYHFFINHWHNYGKALPYTAFPTTDLTLLLCDLAEELSNNSINYLGQRIHAIELLMPSINTIPSSIDYPNLKSLPIKEVLKAFAMSRTLQFLIPYKLYFDNFAIFKTNILNPYYHHHLSNHRYIYFKDFSDMIFHCEEAFLFYLKMRPISNLTDDRLLKDIKNKLLNRIENNEYVGIDPIKLEINLARMLNVEYNSKIHDFIVEHNFFARSHKDELKEYFENEVSTVNDFILFSNLFLVNHLSKFISTINLDRFFANKPYQAAYYLQSITLNRFESALVGMYVYFKDLKYLAQTLNFLNAICVTYILEKINKIHPSLFSNPIELSTFLTYLDYSRIKNVCSKINDSLIWSDKFNKVLDNLDCARKNIVKEFYFEQVFNKFAHIMLLNLSKEPILLSKIEFVIHSLQELTKQYLTTHTNNDFKKIWNEKTKEILKNEPLKNTKNCKVWYRWLSPFKTEMEKNVEKINKCVQKLHL